MWLEKERDREKEIEVGGRRKRGRVQGVKVRVGEAGERENVCSSHCRLPAFWSLSK